MNLLFTKSVFSKTFLLSLFVVFVAINGSAQINLTQGLIGYYPFNGNSNDESGNGHHGIPQNGVKATTDRFGKANTAYLFDGIDDYIRIPSAPGLNPTSAMSVALYFNSSQNSVQTLIGKISYGQGIGTQFQIATGFSLYPGVLFGLNPPGTGCNGQISLNSSYVFTGSSTFTLNQWHCVVATFESGTQKIYLDGVLIQAKNSDFSNLNQCSNSDIQIGSWWASDVQQFKGAIDDIRIYNRALSQDEVDALCGLNPVCNNWLKIPSHPSFVRIGDLDVPGNKITVEATFNRTAPWSGSDLYQGDLVSKHEDPVDCNYLLRPGSAEITTSNGYFKTPEICPVELNKTYHAAMVYDGNTLKFYRNGYLMSQVAATGNLVQNDWQTQIGLYHDQVTQENFLGYINEVRIWNVARSQSDIQAFMNQPLHAPQTTTGLLAYYTFDNLLNKQGNAAWNGTLGGDATINETNPSCTFVADSCNIKPTIVSAQFSVPDTVCVNTPVPITNSTTGASTYFWNFCVADINTTPGGTNLGNIGGVFSAPVFIDYAFHNNNYYGFLINHDPGSLIRLDFGNSLLNTPVAVNLGNFGGIIPPGAGAEAIQIVQNEGRWYAIIVGGNTATGSTPRILKVDFGTDLTNLSPVATNWGNIGNMSQPIDLHVFREGSNWYGFTVNSENNTITRFNFTNNFNNVPTAVNLGNVGNLSYPTGIYAINDNGFWRVFVVNAGNNTRSSGAYSLTRLDFGSSLLNNPVGIILGNPGNLLQHPRDLTIMKMCNQIIGFAVNGHNNNSNVVKINFNNNLSAVPKMESLGNVGNSSFPHSISKLFRVNDDVYGFVTNVDNNTITRLRFSGCSNSSIPNSTDQHPPSVTYDLPGTYNINLTVDDGLPTQSVVCRQVVVLPAPTHSPTRDTAICEGQSIKLGSPVAGATFTWSTGDTTDSIIVNTPGIYWVESGRYGCSVRDSFIVSYKDGPKVDFGFRQDICDPVAVQFFSCLNDVPSLQSIQWDFGNGKTSTSQSAATVYADYGSFAVQLKAQYKDGCISTTTKTIPIDAAFDQTLLLNDDTTICLGDSILLKKKSNILDYCWRASTDGSPIPLDSFVQPTVATTYVLIAEEVGANLVENGDFSQGNSSFLSDFTYSFPNSAEGQFWVGNDPVSWNSNLSSCVDHTSGKGAMMTLNGSSAANTIIWSQTVPVTPHTNYSFSAWIQSLSGPNPARLQFSINNTKLGYGIAVDPVACQWNRYASGWNSGTATTATISIVNDNTNGGGNYFAIDDLFFGPVTIKTDSFKVLVRGLCDSTSISGVSKVCSPTDTVTYSIYKAVNCTQLYSLVVDPDYVDIVEQTPTSLKLVFKKEGSTNIKVAYGNECKIVADSMDVSVRFSPTVINLGADIVVCRDTALVLDAGAGFSSYRWQDGASTPTYSVSSPGVYSILAMNDCGQEYGDNFELIRNIPSPFDVSPANAVICQGDSVQFNASGGTSYSWQPAVKFDSPHSSSPKALVDASETIMVLLSDAVCLRDTVISIPVTAAPAADIRITKTNDVSCSVDSAVLIASGGLSYTWSPDGYISRQGGNRITVRPPVSVTYYVTGLNYLGCAGKDSILVEFKDEGKQKLLIPNAFSPNGDGLNDNFRPLLYGYAHKYEFRIFNRWGELLFQTNVPNKGWDGKYRSRLQPGDVYVYYLRAEGICNDTIERKGTFVLLR